MSYNIGQFKSTSLTNYGTTITIDDSYYGSNKTIASPYGDTAKDGTLSIPNGFKKDNIYHLKFYLTSNSYNISHKITIKLYETKNKFQTIKIINISSPKDNNLIDITFTPDFNFPYLIFEVERNSITINDGSYYYCTGINKAEVLTNIIETPAFGPGNGQILKQIGIQGPPELGFSVNGESLKLGKTGIYESNNMNIKSLGFIIDRNNAQDTNPIKIDDPTFFIVDYLY